MLDAATAGRAVPSSSSSPGCLITGKRSLQPADVGEHADARFEQEEPHQAGDGDRRGDRRGEDRAEDADAAHVLVGEGGEADPEGQADRHRDEGELERHDDRVAELVAADHVEVLVPAADAAVVALGVAPLLAEPHRPAERVEDEHRQQDQRRGEHQHGCGKIAPPIGRPVSVARHGSDSTAAPGLRRVTSGRFHAMAEPAEAGAADQRRRGGRAVARRGRRRPGRRRAGPRAARGRHLLDRRSHR